MKMLSAIPRQINSRFGSKQGLVKYVYFGVRMLLGSYGRFDVKKLGKPHRLVFVCSGNICRSPFAEGVAKKVGYSAISFGLDTRGGDAADARAMAIAEQEGIDLRTHRTTKACDYVPHVGDLIVVMEPKHFGLYKKLKLDIPVTLLGLYGPKSLPYIQDPYSANEAYFARCQKIILHKTTKLIEYVSQ